MISINLSEQTVTYPVTMAAVDVARKLMEMWYSSSLLIQYPFPIQSFGPTPIGHDTQTIPYWVPMHDWKLRRATPGQGIEEMEVIG